VNRNVNIGFLAKRNVVFNTVEWFYVLNDLDTVFWYCQTDSSYAAQL